MRFLPIILLTVSCGFFETKQEKDNPLFVAAKDAGYLKDGVIKSDIENFKQKIVSAKYIESLMVGRTSVSVAEIDNFYEKNKEQFSRKSDEAFVLLFSAKNKKVVRG